MVRTEFAARHWKNGQWEAAPSGVSVQDAHRAIERAKSRKARELRPKVRK